MTGQANKKAAIPGWYAAGLEHIWLPYAQMKTVSPPLPVARTHGARIVLADGRELIDGIASWWTACHGYNHPHIKRAVEAQLVRMPHVMFGGLAHEQALTLAKRLTSLLPGDLTRVFFSDSGSVAVEVAMKMAVQYWINTGKPKKTKFIAFRHSYHGDTQGAMSVTDRAIGMHDVFGDAFSQNTVFDVGPGPAPDLGGIETLLARYGSEYAGIIIEPLVQGAGGMIFRSEKLLRLLRRLADDADQILIFDEIFTGFGRTGTMFAYEQAGVAPDIITLSKALTGGTLPLAATVATRNIFNAFWSDDPKKALMHGPTYMANALACAAANASLDLFEREPRMRQVADISVALDQGLASCRDLPLVKDVRVKGAVGVVELDRVNDLEGLRARFIEQGVFIRPIGNVIYLTPAFTISADELATLTGAIVKTVRELSQ
ncbi:MAG TPA: adenosylmethionine--8-amino-7-oxononanoate transaminase [Pseudolabrys sp.]|nr:adenosylmethionine--8-amino-7-oxononanoate transaminase [Pseudolabrys sp.]